MGGRGDVPRGPVLGPVGLRRAEPADAPAAAELYLRSRSAAAPDVPPTVHADEDVREWWARVVLPQRETWLAEEADGRAVGVLVLDGDELDQLYVDPDRWGRGVGSRLVRHAQERRPGGLALWTFQSNLGAQRFYERHGFRAVERTDGRANEEQAPDVRYAWDGWDDPSAAPPA